MDQELQERITAFFGYWRQRYEFIHNLDFEKNKHEANILLWASFDALSNLWKINIGKKRCRSNKKRLIFDAFLARYGGEIFELISLPDIWLRVDQEKVWIDRCRTVRVPEDVCRFLQNIGGRRTPTSIEERQVRDSSDDLSLNSIIASLRDYSEINCIDIEEWLILSRYGAIAYKEMRSAYIHEGRPGKRTHSFELHQCEVQPTYLSGIYTTPPVISFSVEFMVRTLEHCIDAFEAESLTLQQDPVPEE